MPKKNNRQPLNNHFLKLTGVSEPTVTLLMFFAFNIRIINEITSDFANFKDDRSCLRK